MAVIRRPAVAACLALLGVLRPAAAAGVTAPAGFTAAPAVSGLAQPTAAAFAPDGRLFVLEKAGAVRIWSPATGLASEPAITLPSCTASEMGLLGLAFDPGFATNGFLYLYHSRPPGDDVRRCPDGSAAGRRNRVVRITVTGDRADPASLVEVLGGLRTDNGNHDGGCLRIGPDGFLYVGVGDTGIGDGGRPGASTNPYAGDLAALEGKILRLALDGSPAPGNPFLGRGGAADLVFALGLRNPFRFAFDRRTGLLWVGDVGQDTFEEVSIARAGDDLGWPHCEGFQPAGPCPGNTVPPVFVYPHPEDGASITGGVFYDGAQFDVAYGGDYFFGDFVLDRVWRARLDATRTAFATDPEVFLRDADGPTDFTIGPDGALYYVAFKSGSVVRVTQDHTGAPEPCGRALATAAPRLVRRAARRPTDCAAGCPVPAVPRGVGRTLSRACGASPPAELCAGLGCATCQTTADLAGCLAAAAAAVATDAVRAAGSDATDRCTRSIRRMAPLTASRRLRAVARCARRGGAACVAEEPPVPPSLGPACRTPSPAVCVALACTPCGRTELRGCVDTAVATASDALARTLLGD
jgi:glucose/arabinose dehydrogenase